MQRNFSRDRFTWLAYLSLAFYGYFLNVIGPITPFLKEELNLSYAISSLHYTVFAMGILLVGLGGHLIIAYLGQSNALWLGAAGLSFGAFLLIVGKAPVFTIAATFLMGVVGSLILVIVPSALSERHREMRAVALSESNVIASLVSTVAPLLVGACVRAVSNWRLALGIAALVPVLMYSIFRDAMPREEKAVVVNESGSRQPLPGLYWIYWISIVLAVATEFCMISWSADYLNVALGMPQADAVQAVSLFFIAMIVGRLIVSRLVQRISSYRLVAVSVLTAIAGFLLYWQAANNSSALIGLFLTGLGVAGLYPLILSLAIAAAGNETIQASTRATLASGTAILTLPLALGRLADAIGIRQAYGIVLLLLIGTLVIVLVARKCEFSFPSSQRKEKVMMSK